MYGRLPIAKMIAATVALTAAISAVMVSINWDGQEASTAAPKIDDLLNVMIVLSSFVFSLVMVMLFYALWKFKAKPGDESDGEPIHGNTRLEIAWTVIPTIIVLFGAVYSAIVLADIEKSDPNQLKVDVTGQQYKWSFAYPTSSGTVYSDVLNVPVDRQLNVTVQSIDVIHSFWVPEWRIKRDVVPAGPSGNDIDNNVVVTPDKLGTFNVVCTELCGYGHATMRALVHVWPQAKFDGWLANQEAVQKKTGGPPHPSLGTTGAQGATTTTGAQ
jgi:cytochrome c oxidase subunit 2